MTTQTPVAVVTLPVRNLDTYRADRDGKVWQTLWHKDQIKPGTAVDAIKPLGGEPLEVGGKLSRDGITGSITAIHTSEDNNHWVITVKPETT